MKALRAVGFQGDDLSAIFDQTLNNKVQIVVDHDTYDGKTRAKVQWVNVPGAGGFSFAKPMKRDEMRRFGAEMKSIAKATPAIQGEKVNGVGAMPPTDSSPADDDIAF